MTTFELRLFSPARSETIADAVSFWGKDDSGSFGLLAHAARRIAALSAGLAGFRRAQGEVRHLALAGGLLYFHDNVLEIASPDFLIDADYARISGELHERIQAREQTLAGTRRSLRRLDEEMLKKLLRMRWRSPS